MRILLPLLLACVWSMSAQAEVKTETVAYEDAGTALEGYLAYDAALEGKRPAVLVVHEWYGLNDHAMNSARKLADLGYVAFAVDMYDKTRRTTEPAEAMKWSSEVKGDPALMRSRFEAALDVVRNHELVNADKIAAIGYCFGGTVVLEMARAGLDLDGVVSFHGGLKSALPAEERDIEAKVLVLHGADDPHVPAEEVAAFQDEMRAAGADWQFVSYGNAVHSFTNPKANQETAKYEERAARRSWEALEEFLEEVFE